MTEPLKTRYQLPELFTHLGLLGRGVEVGVDLGHFSAFILAQWPGKCVYLVDDWKWTMRETPGPIRAMEAVRNLKPHEGRYWVMCEPSPACADYFANGSLDWVYIDANHAYLPALADFMAWYPKVKAGGVFCGHDYFDSGDAKRLVREHFVPQPIPEYPQEQFVDWGVKSAVSTLRYQHNLPGEPKVTEDYPPSFYWIKP